MGQDFSGVVEPHREGARVRVRVQTRSSAPGPAGVADDGAGGRALRLRLASPPVGGRANTEAAERLAALLGVRKGDVRLGTGAKGRAKTFIVSGMSESEAARRLAAVHNADG